MSQKKLTQIIHAQIIKTPIPQTLNPILKLLTNSRNPRNALVMYNQMILHSSNCHNHYTFTFAIKACTLLCSHQKAQEIHAHLTKTGHHHDTFIQNSLLHHYVTQNDAVAASKLFGSMPSPNVVSWSLIVSGLARLGFPEEAIDKFLSMDVEPNSFTVVGVLSACSGLRALKLGRGLHCYSLKRFSEDNLVLDNAVLEFYAKCGDLSNAKRVFDGMPDRDVFSWTILVGGYARRGLCEEASLVFRRMIELGEPEPNDATVVNLLSACSSAGALNLGEWVHSYADQKCNLAANTNVVNALVNMYVKCGKLRSAARVFDRLERKDVVSWSTVIAGAALSGFPRLAFQAFSLMLVNGVRPDGVTFLGLLTACSHTGLVGQGLGFFKAMRVYGVKYRTEHFTCLVDMWARAGLLETAEAFVGESSVRAEQAVLGALLNGCRVHNIDEMVDRIWRRVVENGLEVSVGSVALVANTFGDCDRLDDASAIRNEMSSRGVKKPAGCSWINPGT